MNKYHKYKSELGKLPGWVKVGAVALGVSAGMGGVPVPGGGVSKAWAGRYRVEIKNVPHNNGKERCTIFDVMDEVGHKGNFIYEVCGDNSIHLIMARSGGVLSCGANCDVYGFLLRIGGLSIRRNVNGKDLLLDGGNENDFFYIISQRNLSIPKGKALRGKFFAFCFRGAGDVVLDGSLHCLGMLLQHCNFRVGNGGSLCSAALFLDKDSCLHNFREVKYGLIDAQRADDNPCFVPHGDSLFEFQSKLADRWVVMSLRDFLARASEKQKTGMQSRILVLRADSSSGKEGGFLLLGKDVLLSGSVCNNKNMGSLVPCIFDEELKESKDVFAVTDEFTREDVIQEVFALNE